jgi:hypothetical protein
MEVGARGGVGHEVGREAGHGWGAGRLWGGGGARGGAARRSGVYVAVKAR